jgi:hypothetical protein
MTKRERQERAAKIKARRRAVRVAYGAFLRASDELNRLEVELDLAPRKALRTWLGDCVQRASITLGQAQDAAVAVARLERDNAKGVYKQTWSAYRRARHTAERYRTNARHQRERAAQSRKAAVLHSGLESLRNADTDDFYL